MTKLKEIVLIHKFLVLMEWRVKREKRQERLQAKIFFSFFFPVKMDVVFNILKI